MLNSPIFPSEFRFDVINKDWVIIATNRAKKPEAFKKTEKKIQNKKCPFCNLGADSNPIVYFCDKKKIEIKHEENKFSSANKLLNKIPRKWSSIVIMNKYPALIPGLKMEEKSEGRFYKTLEGVGYCELVITRDHKKHFPQFTLSQIKEVFDLYQARYLDLMRKPLVKYISIFHNYGKEAGASQPHPHSQIITTPFIDADLKRSLENSEKFYKKNKKCIYCEMNKWELRVKKRVIFENKNFLVFCPFASKIAFEIVISPKFHSAFFEEISEEQKWDLAAAFSVAMKKICRGLNNPPYNFYLHTAPCGKEKNYSFYHWHLTIMPKTSIGAGFELGTRMEISTLQPEKAADYLRKI